jgi:peptidoglycan/LPS O-acetylase OafA/YrhL
VTSRPLGDAALETPTGGPPAESTPAAEGSATGNKPGLIGHLRRITTSGRFIPEVDGIRFVAIGAVILFHLNGYMLARVAGAYPDHSRSWLARLALHGDYGVQLFYVLSGFILGLPFARMHLLGGPPVRLRAYFLRRVTRLEPPYLLNLLLMFAALLLFKGASAAVLAPHLAASALYQHSLVYGEMSLINGVAWSLEVEIQFYVLVPVLTAVFAVSRARERRALLVAAILIAACVHLIPAEILGRLALTIVYFLGYFLAGFLLADMYLVSWRERPSRDWRWDVLLGVSAAAAIWAVHDALAAAFVLPFLFLAMCAALFRSVVVRALLTNPLLTAIGGMCYTIYLYHFVLIAAGGRYTMRLPMPASYGGALLMQLLLLGTFVVIGSAVLFWLVERPCMRRDWPQRLVTRLGWRTLNATSRTGGASG